MGGVRCLGLFPKKNVFFYAFPNNMMEERWHSCSAYYENLISPGRQSDPPDLLKVFTGAHRVDVREEEGGLAENLAKVWQAQVFLGSI